MTVFGVRRRVEAVRASKKTHGLVAVGLAVAGSTLFSASVCDLVSECESSSSPILAKALLLENQIPSIVVDTPLAHDVLALSANNYKDGLVGVFKAPDMQSVKAPTAYLLEKLASHFEEAKTVTTTQTSVQRQGVATVAESGSTQKKIAACKRKIKNAKHSHDRHHYQRVLKTLLKKAKTAKSLQISVQVPVSEQVATIDWNNLGGVATTERNKTISALGMFTSKAIQAFSLDVLAERGNALSTIEMPTDKPYLWMQLNGNGVASTRLGMMVPNGNNSSDKQTFITTADCCDIQTRFADGTGREDIVVRTTGQGQYSFDVVAGVPQLGNLFSGRGKSRVGVLKDLNRETFRNQATYAIQQSIMTNGFSFPAELSDRLVAAVVNNPELYKPKAEAVNFGPKGSSLPDYLEAYQSDTFHDMCKAIGKAPGASWTNAKMAINSAASLPFVVGTTVIGNRSYYTILTVPSDLVKSKLTTLSGLQGQIMNFGGFNLPGVTNTATLVNQMRSTTPAAADVRTQRLGAVLAEAHADSMTLVTNEGTHLHYGNGIPVNASTFQSDALTKQFVGAFPGGIPNLY